MKDLAENICYEVGELIYDFEAMNVLKVRRNKPLIYAVQRADSTLFLKYNSKDKDVIKAGTTYGFLMRVPFLENGKQSLGLSFNQHRSSIGLKKNPFGFSATTPYGGVALKVYGMDGKEQSLDYLQENYWYNYEFTLTEDVKIVNIGPDPNNSRAVNLTYNLQGNTEAHIAEFKLGDECFNASFVGDLGSKFVWKPDSKPIPFRTQEDGFFGNILQRYGCSFELSGSLANITPQMAGYKNGHKRDVNNPASEYIQVCADSEYNVRFPDAFYYLDKEVDFTKMKEFSCGGSVGYNAENKEHLRNFNDNSNRSSTIFWSDKNISFFKIKNFGIKWFGGYFTSQHIKDHDKAFFEIDLNYNTGRIQITNVMMEGKRETLLKTGKGTKGIWFNLDVREGTIGYTYNNDFTGIYGVFLDSIIAISNANQFWRSQNFDMATQFINLLKICVEGWGCKRPIYMLDGGANIIKVRHQSEAVLNEEEKGFYAVTVKGGGNIIDIHMGDNMRVDTGQAPYRHGPDYLDAPMSTNHVIDRTYLLSDAALASMDFARLNKRLILNSPNNHYLYNNGVISDLNSSVRYAGDYGNVTYKGYLAPNKEWFEENLYTKLKENNEACFIGAAEFLLNSRPMHVTPHHIIKQPNGFAEVEIEMPMPEDIYKVQMALGTGDKIIMGKIQMIAEDETGQRFGITVGAFDINASFPIPVNHLVNKNIRKLIFRFFGSNKMNFMTQILDIAVIQKGNKGAPLVNIGNQTQRKTGEMIFDKPLKTIGNGTSELVSVEEVEKMIKEQLKVLMKK